MDALVMSVGVLEQAAMHTIAMDDSAAVMMLDFFMGEYLRVGSFSGSGYRG